MGESPNCLVLWRALPADRIGSATVFSFLAPVQEARLAVSGVSSPIVTMSRMMDDVAPDARRIYIDLIADMGRLRMEDGRTVRSTLRREGKASAWWYHPITFRNSENETVYTDILSVLAIAKEARSRGFTRLRLVGPPPGIAKVLGAAFSVEVTHRSWTLPASFDLVRAFVGRLRFLVRMLEIKFALSRYYRYAPTPVDVTLQGYWDWSIYPDDSRPSGLSDRYFGRLPEELRSRGKSVGYWGWYDPWNRPGQRRRSHKSVLAPLEGRRDVLLLPALLSIRDIFSVLLDFSALPILVKVVRSESFGRTCMREGLDFLPLFMIPLLRGGLSAGIPQCRLVEVATERARICNKPHLTIRFQEHNPPSRAVYAATRGTGTKAWAAQHASYSSGKTYLAFHAQKEFGEDQDDEQPVPRPDRVCVMGEFGRALFGDCGYDSAELLVTGAARYDDVSPGRQSVSPVCDSGWPRHILIATSLPASVDIRLVESVIEAANGLEGITIRIRQHPFDRIEALPGFGRLASMLRMSSSTLSEDLSWADLVIVSQSTVGEEAYLAGNRVWQFRFPHPNQSALAEVADIRRFYTVSGLRDGFRRFIAGQDEDPPSKADIERVYRALFQTADVRPSVAIADAIAAAT